MATLIIENSGSGKLHIWENSENFIPLKNNPIPTIITENQNLFFIKPEKNILLNGHRFSQTKEIKNDDRIQYFDQHGVLETFKVIIKNSENVIEKLTYTGKITIPESVYSTRLGEIKNQTITIPPNSKVKFEKLNKNVNSKNYEINEYFNLNQFSKFCYNESKANGFHSEESGNPDLSKYLMNLHTEISELWEAYRNNNLNNTCDKAEKMVTIGIAPLTCFEEELADIIIRAGDTAAAFGIDLEKAVLNKILFNRTRSYRNGNKLC